MIIPADLQPGDFLLYGGTGVFADGIKLASGEPLDGGVCHIEVYAGGGQSWASRDGIGVDRYPFRPADLMMVRRPVQPFDTARIDDWFPKAKGIPYGWEDIGANLDVAGVAAAMANNSKGGMDCSHFAATVAFIAHCPQFDETFDARRIKPRDFKLSREAKTIWTA